MKGGGNNMGGESREDIGLLGKLFRQTDGSPIVVQKTDTQYEMDPRRRERRPSSDSVTPRVSTSPIPGSLVEIPGEGGGGFFRVAEPSPGQSKPDSVFVERISQSDFEKAREAGTPVARPDNL
jgi:hypothetical protein